MQTAYSENFRIKMFDFGDYIILMCYYLKILGVTKTEIKTFIRDFEKMTDEYMRSVNQSVASMVIRPDLASRMTTLKNFI